MFDVIECLTLLRFELNLFFSVIAMLAIFSSHFSDNFSRLFKKMRNQLHYFSVFLLEDKNYSFFSIFLAFYNNLDIASFSKLSFALGVSNDYYPSYKQGYCNRILDFLPVKNFVHRLIPNFKISFFSTLYV